VYSSVPIYISQLYLLLTICTDSRDKVQLRGSIALTIIAAVAAVVASFAEISGVNHSYGLFFAWLHCGIISAVALTLLVSSLHIWSYAGY